MDTSADLKSGLNIHRAHLCKGSKMADQLRAGLDGMTPLTNLTLPSQWLVCRRINYTMHHSSSSEL